MYWKCDPKQKKSFEKTKISLFFFLSAGKVDLLRVRLVCNYLHLSVPAGVWPQAAEEKVIRSLWMCGFTDMVSNLMSEYIFL